MDWNSKTTKLRPLLKENKILSKLIVITDDNFGYANDM